MFGDIWDMEKLEGVEKAKLNWVYASVIWQAGCCSVTTLIGFLLVSIFVG